MNRITEEMIAEVKLERERVKLDTAKARLDQIRLESLFLQRRMDQEYPVKSKKAGR